MTKIFFTKFYTLRINMVSFVYTRYKCLPSIINIPILLLINYFLWLHLLALLSYMPLELSFGV
jgi:hypothetical protein